MLWRWITGASIPLLALEALTDSVKSATETKASKGKEIRILGPEHPITIFPLRGKVPRMWVDHGDCYSSTCLI
jgi:hypothetical protein